jgi:hypothetical protein
MGITPLFFSVATLTAKMFYLTRKNKNGFQRKSLKGFILVVGREGIEPSTY